MYQHRSFKHERISEDKLSCVTWAFYLIGSDLVVESYTEFGRPTTRHKFKANPGRTYSRHNSRNHPMKLADLPELTTEFKDAILDAFIAEVRSMLTVKLAPH